MARAGLILGLIALLIGGVTTLPQPCADDLLVETGGPDRCVGSLSGREGSTAPPPSVCPCACHMGVASGHERPPLTTLVPLAGVFPPPIDARSEFFPPPVTHPPLA